jgi:hypothetical protein
VIAKFTGSSLGRTRSGQKFTRSDSVGLKFYSVGLGRAENELGRARSGPFTRSGHGLGGPSANTNIKDNTMCKTPFESNFGSEC